MQQVVKVCFSQRRTRPLLEDGDGWAMCITDDVGYLNWLGPDDHDAGADGLAPKIAVPSDAAYCSTWQIGTVSMPFVGDGPQLRTTDYPKTTTMTTRQEWSVSDGAVRVR